MENELNERLFFGYAYIFEKENEAPKFLKQGFDENEEVKLSLVDSISEATMFNSPAIANEVGKYISGFGHRGFVGQCLPAENGYATVRKRLRYSLRSVWIRRHFLQIRHKRDSERH